jgi:phage shock protein PspC (stress-responsive transcriptional regulator)
MNKTVTINISGLIFHIEEDAYQNLNGYLTALKARFRQDNGGSEIMADIEARIAELMQQRLNPGKQVLVNTDVEEVKAIMGRPEDLGEETGSEEKAAAPQHAEPVKRRFFRDPDDKVIGGVCSGLAAYFDIDRVWVRLAMFLLIFFGGLSLWVYIILWIVIPQARTTAEKLAMRGKPANINTIMKNFKDEADDVKNRFARYGNEAGGAYGDRVRDNVSGVLSTVFSIIGRVIGFILLLIGGGLLLVYVAALTGISAFDFNSEVTNWKEAIFASGSDYTLAFIAFILVFGIPVFLILYAGIKLLFRIRYSNRWLALTLGIGWVLGIIIGVYVSVKTGQQFSESARVKDVTDLSLQGDTLIVKMHPTPDLYPGGDRPFRHGRVQVNRDNKKITIVGAPGFDVVESSDGKVSLEVTRHSRGSDKRQAYELARAIDYHHELTGNALLLDENFVIREEVKYRDPKIEITLSLPPGKVIYLDRSLRHMLDDVDNVSNTWDGDMVGRRWKMTEKGLECVDCDNLESIYEHPRPDKHQVRINKDGIHVQNKDEEVIIDKDEIRVRSKDGKTEKSY